MDKLEPCPRCGDHITELVHELRYIESVYRQNCVEPREPSSALEGLQKLLAKYEYVR